MKKILISALILGVVSISGISTFADTGGKPTSTKISGIHKAAIIEALENNTYASLPDVVKAKVTEKQFNKAHEKHLKKAQDKTDKHMKKDEKKTKKDHKANKRYGKPDSKDNIAIKAAVAAGDYTAFREAKIAQIPTEAEFQKRVAAHKIHIVALAAMQTAVKNNDFTAFKKAHTDMRAAMSELHVDNEDIPKTPDATKMKKHFDEMVAKYTADGTLPEKFDKGEMEKGEEKHMGE